jgi:predicted DNA-binding protein with PD1-like motif
MNDGEEKHGDFPEAHLHAGVGRREESFTGHCEGPRQTEDGMTLIAGERRRISRRREASTNFRIDV